MEAGGHAVRVLDNFTVGTRQDLAEVCDFTEIDPADSFFSESSGPKSFCELMAAHAASPYGAGKLAGEGYCSADFQSYGLSAVVLQFGNVYGPGSTHKNSVVAKFIKQAGGGGALEIYGDGSQTRDFIYIDDLVKAIILSRYTENIGGEIFQIATNRETTIREMVETLLPILKMAGINDVRVTHGERRVGDVRRNFSDTTKAERLLGWQCTYTLQQGLE